MAASFVANGAVDERMFNDANGEQLVALAKIEPFLAEYRTRTGNPNYLVHLERVVMKRPGAKEAMAAGCDARALPRDGGAALPLSA